MLDSEKQEQFTRLWTEVQPTVSAYVCTAIRDAHVAKDVVQEAALELMRKFEQWDPARPFLPWALGVAKMKILSCRRDAGRCRVIFDDTLLDAIAETWASVAAEVDNEQNALQECLEKLSRRSRKIVDLKYSDGLRAPQIAEQLGASAGAVRISLTRIRAQLQQCVERHLRVEGANS